MSGRCRAVALGDHLGRVSRLRGREVGPERYYPFPELTVVGTPRIPRAHWEAPRR